MGISRNYLAKIYEFIFAKFCKIQNNFVKILCFAFAKFYKCCFAATIFVTHNEQLFGGMYEKCFLLMLNIYNLRQKRNM